MVDGKYKMRDEGEGNFGEHNNGWSNGPRRVLSSLVDCQAFGFVSIS
jgi:hypothetical protein